MFLLSIKDSKEVKEITFFPLYSSREKLSIIQNINFTPREIDVIACLVGMRGASRIAGLLFISPHTVTTHIHNIMLKLDRRSRESILDFIEDSDTLSLLRQHYEHLLLHEKFEKSLQKLALYSRQHKKELCVMQRDIEPRKNFLFTELAAHLKKAGIFSCVQETEMIYQHENIHSSSFYVLLKEKNEQQHLFDFSPIHVIHVGSQENYYTFVSELLAKIFPQSLLNELNSITKESVNKKLEASNLTTFLDLKRKVNGQIVKQRFIQKFAQPKTIFLIFFSCFAYLLFTRIILEKNNTSKFLRFFCSSEKEEKGHSFWVRSDLKIPAEPVLLHRPDIIAALGSKFKNHQGIKAIVLTGIGGAGKTTLAHLYASLQKIDVIWEVNAETQESLKRSFENLAHALCRTEKERKLFHEIFDLKDTVQKEAKTIQFIKERLRQAKEWLLIFDNVEQFTDIKAYFPQDPMTWGQGKVIITTRDSNIQNNPQICHTIQIDEITAQEKLDLFTRILTSDSPKAIGKVSLEETKKFLEEISSFPLDISIAAYYLRSTHISYKAYLERLQRPNPDFKNIQEILLKESGAHTHTRYNLIFLSVQKLCEIHEAFSSLLILISLLNSQNIPRELLACYKNEAIVDNFIYHLKKYSFVTKEPTDPSYSSSLFSIHRGIQQVILFYFIKTLNLEKNKISAKLIEHSVIHYAERVIDELNLSKMKILFAHYKNLLKSDALLTNESKKSINQKLGIFYFYFGDYIKAKNFLENILTKSARHEKKNHNKSAQASLYLGAAYEKLGHYEKAKILLENSLFIYEKNIPLDYAGIALVSSYLGNIYRILLENEKAKEILMKSRMIYETHFPTYYAGLAGVFNNLGLLYREISHREKAQFFLEKSIEIYKKHMPENSVQIARSLSSLGGIHALFADYKKAKNLFEESLMVYKKYFSEDHIDIAFVLHRLGEVCYELGHYEKAENLLRYSFKIYKNTYSSHDHEAWILGALGKVHTALGNYEKAKSFLEESLAIFTKHFSENYIHSGWASVLLGNIYRELGDYKKAKNFIEKGCSIYRKYLPENCPDVAWATMHLGDVYKELGNYHMARSLIEKNIVIFENHFGKNNVRVAQVLQSFSKIHLLENRLEKAEHFAKRALNIFLQNNHPGSYISLEILAEIYFKKFIGTKESLHFKMQTTKYLKQALQVVRTNFPANSSHLRRIQEKIKNLEKIS